MQQSKLNNANIQGISSWRFRGELYRDSAWMMSLVEEWCANWIMFRMIETISRAWLVRFINEGKANNWLSKAKILVVEVAYSQQGLFISQIKHVLDLLKDTVNWVARLLFSSEWWIHFWVDNVQYQYSWMAKSMALTTSNKGNSVASQERLDGIF